MESGKVYLPKNASWVPDMVSELLHFPAGVHDDQVDVLSLFGRMIDPVQVFDQAAVQRALSDDVEPLFGSG